MTPQFAAYPHHRFPAEIIGHAVWLLRVPTKPPGYPEPILRTVPI